MKQFRALPCILMGAVMIAGCGTATYVDKGEGETEVNGLSSQVVYQLYDVYRQAPPGCVAILPLTVPKGGASTLELRIDQAQTVRRALYAHLSPQGKRDVELPRIDFVLSHKEALKNDLPTLGKTLNCDAVIRGHVTEYGSQFLGVYSRVAVGADLEMVRIQDGAKLWQGRHVAESHGGSFPLSPIGLAMSIVEAASNVREEQVFRVIDDLSRRLVGTIPDDRIAVLEDPAQSPILGVALKQEAPSASAFIAGLAGLHDHERKMTMLAAISDERFDYDGSARLYREVLQIAPSDVGLQERYGVFLLNGGDFETALTAANSAQELAPDTASPRFLRGRALLKLGRVDEADGAIVEAIARDDTKAVFYNGLGYVNSVRGNTERAIAAYRMAIERDPFNGFAYYNMGVGFYNVGDPQNAADSFYGAGLAYIKTGNYGQAEKAIEDLNSLAADGVDVGKETTTLRAAIARISKTKGEKP